VNVADSRCRAVHRDGALLHRLEQRGLRLRRRAVDLVRQHEIGEDRPRPEGELPRAGEECNSGDVGGHQIGSELDALELDVEGERQSAYQQRLRRPGHPLEQHVTAGQQTHQRLARRRLLPQDHPVERL